MSKIIFENVYKSFGALRILDGVSFELDANDAMAILGRSGVGKSVTLKLLLGLMQLDSGDIIVNGISVRDKKRRREYRSFFSVLFQGNALFDSMTVLENVMFPLINHGVNTEKAKNAAYECIESVGLSKDVINLFPSSLSGGMQKRAALARAIIVRPDIMLFDEPTSGLDPLTSAKISRLIKSILADTSITTLTITHDLSVAYCFCSKAAMLDNGKFVWNGDISAIEQSDSGLVQEFLRAHSNLDGEE